MILEGGLGMGAGVRGYSKFKVENIRKQRQ